jgi:leader peptidase (prepilin peptidase)/N-methyltransferase
MYWGMVIFGGVLGLIVGSFSNVVILRSIAGKSLTGRSQCIQCMEQLRIRDLIPVLSYLLLKGRCRHCSAHISIQYPLVEGLVAATFAVIVAQMVPILSVAEACMLVLALLFAALAIIIAVIDLYTTIIPDVLVYPLSLVALGATFFTTGVPLIPHPSALIAGPLVAFPLAFLWAISRGRWIGLGDAKYALAMGWLLGVAHGVSALALAFWIGAIVSVGLLYGTRMYHVWFTQQNGLSHETSKLTMKSEVPFGPFLIIATGIVAFTGFDLIALIS